MAGQARTRSRSPITALGAALALVLALAGVWTGMAPGALGASDPAGTPFGHFDNAVAVPGGIQVWGWAIDPDTTGSINVRVTVDGVNSYVIASQARADIGKAYPSYGENHGFATTIPAAAGSHQVCVTAVNVGAGSSKSFGCRTVSVPGTTSGSTSGSTSTGSTSTGTPSASNTGVPSGTSLRVHNGNLTITAAGTVVDGLDVTGTIIVKADNVTIKNTRVRGVTSNKYTTPLIHFQSGHTNLVVQDSELIPSSPSAVHYGIIGWNFTLDRVEIAKVVDGVHIIGSNTVVRNSYIHDVRAYTVNGSTTHSDGVQIQIGSNHRLVNNTIEGGYNAAIQVTQDRGVTSDLQVTGNYMDGGMCTVNLAEKAYGPLRGVVISGNTFGRSTRVYDCAVVNPITTILSVSNNYFTDGVAIRVRKA